MSYRFDEDETPIPVIAAKYLSWLAAALIFFQGASYVISTLIITSDTTSYSATLFGQNLAGESVIPWGVGISLYGIVLAVVTKLGSDRVGARWVAAVLEVVALIALTLNAGGQYSGVIFIDALLGLSAVLFIWSAATRAGLDATPAAAAAEESAATLPPIAPSTAPPSGDSATGTDTSADATSASEGDNPDGGAAAPPVADAEGAQPAGGSPTEDAGADPDSTASHDDA